MYFTVGDLTEQHIDYDVSSPDSPNGVQINFRDTKMTWLDGIVGCLRPVLTIMGKKHQPGKFHMLSISLK